MNYLHSERNFYNYNQQTTSKIIEKSYLPLYSIKSEWGVFTRKIRVLCMVDV